MANRYELYARGGGGGGGTTPEGDDDIIGSYADNEGSVLQGNEAGTTGRRTATPAGAQFSNVAAVPPTAAAAAPTPTPEPQPPAPPPKTDVPDPQLNALANDVRPIEEQFAVLRENQATLTYLTQRLKTITSTGEATKVQGQIEELTQTSRTLLETTRKRIKHLAPKGGKAKTPQELIRRNQQLQLARQLYALAQAFQAQQITFKTDVVEKLKRQYKIVRPNAADAEVDDYVANASLYNTQSNNVFQQAALSGREQALSAFQEAKSQQAQLQRLNAAIDEMVALFQDMQVLLDTQGEQIDQIQVNSEAVVVNMADASKEMSRAIVSRISARKRAWIIFALLFVVITIIVLIVVFSLKK